MTTPGSMLVPKLPVYPPVHMLGEHEVDVDAMFDAATGQIVAVCPGGHYAQVFEAGDDGAVHTDHQPCPGAWWFVETTDAALVGDDDAAP